MGTELIIAYVSIVSVFIPLVPALLKWKKIPQELLPLCWILIISFLCDGASFFLVKRSFNTNIIVNFYLLSQFSLLFQMLYRELRRTPVLKILYVGFLVFYLINFFFIQGPWIFNSFSNVLASLILISMALFYFYKLITELPALYIHRLPMLWISFAIFVYYGGTFFLFLLNNYLTYGESGNHRMLWVMHNLLNITKNIIFAIALWQSYRKVNSSSS